MDKVVHTNVEVIQVKPSDNHGVAIDTEKVIKNINDLFKREDIKQLNAMLEANNKFLTERE